MNPFMRAVTAVAVCCAVLLTGCVSERPIVSKRVEYSNMTLTEQRNWVSGQFDDVVALSGVPDGWYDIYWKDVFWAADRPEDRELLIRAWVPEECGEWGGRVSTAIKNTSAEDPLHATAKVKAAWKARGVPIRDLYDSHHNTAPYFIADFGESGTVSVQATEKLISVAAHAGCSMDRTILNWHEHLDDAANPFREELEKRETDAG